MLLLYTAVLFILLILPTTGNRWSDKFTICFFSRTGSAVSAARNSLILPLCVLLHLLYTAVLLLQLRAIDGRPGVSCFLLRVMLLQPHVVLLLDLTVLLLLWVVDGRWSVRGILSRVLLRLLNVLQ